MPVAINRTRDSFGFLVVRFSTLRGKANTRFYNKSEWVEFIPGPSNTKPAFDKLEIGATIIAFCW